MIWAGWADFWAMGGQAFYVWMSYGVWAGAIVAELVLLRLRSNRALARIEEERDLETQD
jgi:heme exporter protein D